MIDSICFINYQCLLFLHKTCQRQLTPALLLFHFINMFTAWIFLLLNTVFTCQTLVAWLSGIFSCLHFRGLLFLFRNAVEPVILWAPEDGDHQPWPADHDQRGHHPPLGLGAWTQRGLEAAGCRVDHGVQKHIRLPQVEFHHLSTQFSPQEIGVHFFSF